MVGPVDESRPFLVAISRAWCGWKKRRLPYFWCTNILAKDISMEEVVYYCIFCPGGPNSTGHRLHFSLFMRCFFSRHPKAVSVPSRPNLDVRLENLGGSWHWFGFKNPWRAKHRFHTFWLPWLCQGVPWLSHGCDHNPLSEPLVADRGQWSSWLQEWLERRGDRSVDSQFAALSSAHPTGPLTAESGWATQMVSEVILIEGETHGNARFV